MQHNAYIVPACESDAHMNQKRHFMLIWTKILFVGLAKDNQGFQTRRWC